MSNKNGFLISPWTTTFCFILAWNCSLPCLQIHKKLSNGKSEMVRITVAVRTSTSNYNFRDSRPPPGGNFEEKRRRRREKTEFTPHSVYRISDTYLLKCLHTVFCHMKVFFEDFEVCLWKKPFFTPKNRTVVAVTDMYVVGFNFAEKYFWLFQQSSWNSTSKFRAIKTLFCLMADILS